MRSLAGHSTNGLEMGRTQGPEMHQTYTAYRYIRCKSASLRRGAARHGGALEVVRVCGSQPPLLIRVQFPGPPLAKGEL